MLLDGDKVNIGDKVYDLRWGTATVEALNVDGTVATARTGTGIEVRFASNGKRAGATNRMVYWSAPMVIAPLKGDNRWPRIRGAIQAVYDVMVDHVAGS